MRTPDGQAHTFMRQAISRTYSRGVLAINSAGEITGDYGKYGGEASDGEGGTFSYYFDASFLRLADGTIFRTLVPRMRIGRTLQPSTIKGR